MNKILLPLIFIFPFSSLFGQFVTEGGDTLYGNEWIDHELEYFKIPVAKDGMYRISFSDLIDAGIPAEDLSGGNFQMVHNGRAYPLYVSNNNSFVPGDYLEFYGRRNRGELDRVFYEDPDNMQLNPEYSLFTDTAAYFLTWNTGTGNLRVNERETPENSGMTPELFYMHKERLVFNERVHKPTRNGSDNVRYSHFDVGEGFGGNLSKRNSVTIPAQQIFEDGPDATVDIRFTTNATVHEIDLSFNGSKKASYDHSGYKLRQERVEIPVSELKGNNTLVLEGLVDNFDRNIISIVDLNYPRKFDFNEESYFEFFMEGGIEERYIEIRDFEGGSSSMIYDPGTATRIKPTVEGDLYRFIIPASSEDRLLIAYNAEETESVEELKKMDFMNYAELDEEFIIISHPTLIEGSSSKVQEYADYRRSAAGGGYRTVVVSVEDLYEQFSYGIHRHSFSIKNFANWVAKNWKDPQFIFIIGKGREYGYYRTEEEIEDPINRSFYVPSFGLPASDNLLVSNDISSTVHVIPTGRIAAKDDDDVALYLEKVKQHEDFENRPLTVEDRLWKKRIMHLAGAETALQESIGTYLETMENEIETSRYGASVTTYKKSSTETIQEADADNLLNNIDEGLSILTFFGHSSVGTFDFNIDDVNKLQNFEKYPLVISLGCFSGNVHTQSYGISEQYVLTAGKGAIAFLASSSTAYVAPQGNFGIEYYEKLGNEFYGASLGEVLQSSLRERDKIFTIHTKILNEQMTLHGDPSIKLFSAEQPDFTFDHRSFRTEPSVVESNQSEFDLIFDVVNLGLAVEDSIQIDLSHVKNNGDVGYELSLRVPSPEFDTTITVTIQNNDNANVGKNLIKGVLDAPNEIAEGPSSGAEENNTIIDGSGEEGFVFFSTNNSAIPVSPCDFGIYNEEEVVLRASTYNALGSKEVKYVLELDTTASFNSPLKVGTTINTIGGLIEWEPVIGFEHGTVYYWRISPDSISAEIGYRWEDASFVYLPNSSNGWNQSHYYQFLENEFDGLNFDSKTREIEFDTSGFFIKIFNSIWDPNTTGYQFNFDDFASSVRPWSFMNSGVAIVVADTINGGAWRNSGGEFGSIQTSSPGSRRTFGFRTQTAEERAGVINFLENVVPDGYFVFFFTVLRDFNSDFVPENWASDAELIGTDIYSVLEKQGSVFARDMQELGSVPYTFIYQKNRKVLAEEIGEDKSSSITSTAFIPLKRKTGELKISKIGPAKSWDRLLWSQQGLESSDTINLELILVDTEGNESSYLESSSEKEIDLSGIDANIYPYLKIITSIKDEENATPVNVDYWRVFYEGFPDASLGTDGNFKFTRDTLQQGEDLELVINIQNTSTYNLDSLSIDIEITSSNNDVLSFRDRIQPLSAKEGIDYAFTYNTRELTGSYRLSFNVNGNREVEEKNHFNNFGVREFTVLTDNLNPVLDVSFDGIKIMDGDLVSPTPEIVMELKDENKFLLLDDPSIYDIILVEPDGNPERIEITDERITFYPAESSDKNVARLEFRPDFDQDGTYKLIVNAKDKNANISGTNDFERSFEIINKEMVSNVLNYPNPFSTSTEFIFTLTGREIPTDLKIEIFTVSGKVVKEIFKEELGDLRIGVNRSEYKWDGKDDYGNDLSNGVYLYRVIAKNGDDGIDKYEVENLSQYFKNNIGKMVILR